MTKLNKSTFVTKARNDLSRFNTAIKERQKEVMLKDYETHCCRNRWDITRPGERRRDRI